MADTAQLREGMVVFGAVDQFVGTIERLEPNGMVVNGRFLPHDCIERVAADRVYVSSAAAQDLTSEGAPPAGAAEVFTPGTQRDVREPSPEVVAGPPETNPQNSGLSGSAGTTGSSAMPSPTAREETPRDKDLTP